MTQIALQAGPKKVVYVDREAFTDGSPAYIVRSQGRVWRCSRLTGNVRFVQCDRPLIEGGPRAWAETNAQLLLLDTAPLAFPSHSSKQAASSTDLNNHL